MTGDLQVQRALTLGFVLLAIAWTALAIGDGTTWHIVFAVAWWLLAAVRWFGIEREYRKRLESRAERAHG